MSLLRARFDECQSVAGIGVTHKKGPLPIVRACKEARVRRFVKHPSVLFAICRERWLPEVISNMEEQGKSEESSKSTRCFSRRAPRLSSTVRCTSLGLAVRQLHTHYCRNNQSAISAPWSAIRTAAATGRASKLVDQTKSSQIRRSKTSRAYPKYVDGAALELTYLRRMVSAGTL